MVNDLVIVSDLQETEIRTQMALSPQASKGRCGKG